MALVNISNVIIENPIASFESPININITFECLKEVQETLEWKVIYVGSAKDQKYDQVLDEFEMGPLSPGVMQFAIEASPPDYRKVPSDQLLRVTAIILSVSYRSKEFFRVGYYVYNQYNSQGLIDSPPEKVDISQVTRSILADKPRITRLDISWNQKEKTELASTTNEVCSEDLEKSNGLQLPDNKESLAGL